ncbi:MAG: hypothetical protein LUO94_07385, partial [Methylococcaceae bacterium]|nr:hypothetical protein [Methylococcaceae bacterium]
PVLKAKGKTELIIIHDDCHFYLADRSIKLEEGQILEIEYLTLNIQNDHRLRLIQKCQYCENSFFIRWLSGFTRFATATGWRTHI